MFETFIFINLTYLLYYGKVSIMDSKSIWNTNNTTQLANVLSGITDLQIMQSFLRDVMTEKEIVEISTRLEAAKMLTNGKKYDEVVKKTKLSTRTVARISNWLQNGCKGYKKAISLIEQNHHNLAS